MPPEPSGLKGTRSLAAINTSTGQDPVLSTSPEKSKKRTTMAAQEATAETTVAEVVTQDPQQVCVCVCV